MASPNVHSFGRRNSAASPYLIPQKSGHKFPHHHHHHHVIAPPVSKLSSSVPTLTRGFVTRRISEGETGRLKEQLNCEACGKGYKHISSLAKHLWEHTPEWNMTKKLLLSKHQQVQLLEAASILVTMQEPDEYEQFASSPTPETIQFAVSYDTPGRLGADASVHAFSSPTARSYLISEYPPSLIPSTYSPMPGYVGGYLDVPKKRESSPDDDKDDDDARKHELTDAAGETSDEEDEEDEILGKME